MASSERERVILDPNKNDAHYRYVTEITYFNHMSEMFLYGRCGCEVDQTKADIFADKAMNIFFNPPFHFTHIDEQQGDDVSNLEYVKNYPGDVFVKLFLSAIFYRKHMDLF